MRARAAKVGFRCGESSQGTREPVEHVVGYMLNHPSPLDQRWQTQGIPDVTIVAVGSLERLQAQPKWEMSG